MQVKLNPQTSFAFALHHSLATEGVKYAGSKAKLLKYIVPEIASLPGRSVLDGFAGTTRVSQALARAGFNVTVNDRALLSRILGQCYLLGDPDDVETDEQISFLNSLSGVDGWFTEHYGGSTDAIGANKDHAAKPWQRHNTMRLDAIRPAIDKIARDEINKSVLLTSLIRALDAVDSTLGHYASYLSRWAPRSYKDLELQKPAMVGTSDSQQHCCLSQDIFDVLEKTAFDVCYFDPPYGSNNDKMPPSRVRYGAYYHLWKTIILNDMPETFGRVKRREDSRDRTDYSEFEDFRRNKDGYIAVSAIDRLLKAAQSPFIVLSYSSGGRATFEELMDVITSSGNLLKTLQVDHRKHVMASMVWTGAWSRNDDAPHQEYVFVIEKR